MFNSAIEKFIAKRLIIYFLILSVIDLLFFKSRWLILAGFFVGAILSILQFVGYARVLGKTFSPDKAKHTKKWAIMINMAAFVLNQLILLPLLFYSYFYNIWIFAGFLAGILLVPFILMINSITEILGISKNNFE